MSNFPKVYSIEEQQERFDFQRFLQKHFILSKRATKTFTGELSAETLLFLYKQNHPDTMLTPDIIKQMLLSGGFINPTVDAVTLDIRDDAWDTFQKEFQVAILKYIGDSKLRFKFGQHLYGVTVGSVAPVVMMDISIQRFINAHLFMRDKFKYWYHLKNTDQKVGTKYAYWYYQKFCLEEGFTPVSRKDLISALVRIGGEISQSYYAGQSGVSVINKMCLPTKKLAERSFELGLGVLSVNGSLYFNDNTPLNSFSEEGLEAYVKGRRTKVYGTEEREQTVETFQEEGQQDINRGSIEDEKADVSSGEEGDGQTLNSEGFRGSIYSSEGDGGQSSEVSDGRIDNGRTTEVRLYDDDKCIDTTIYADEECITYEDDGCGEIEGFNGEFDECDDLDGTTTAECERICGTVTDDDNEEFGAKPTVKEIFATLKVPYKINPGTFNKEMMSEYLLMMHPSLRVEDYWDAFIKEMQGV